MKYWRFLFLDEFALIELLFYVWLTRPNQSWQSWDEVSTLGMVCLLFMFIVAWIVLDLLRILRVRRMLKAIDRYPGRCR